MSPSRFRKNPETPDARASEKGQASIMIGVMVLTMIIFFAFVVNTGMLVHARINLQNAADLAAYSGAAVQARQLTAASYVNMEMRRAYKKFLFRYYVIGNMAMKSFPRPGGEPGSGPAVWKPAGSSGTANYEVPAVCLTFKETDNFCQIDRLIKLVLPPTTRLDNINEVLRGQLIKLEGLRQRNCGAIGKINRRVLLNWMFSSDVEPPPFDGSSDPDAQKIAQLTKGLALGLGLVPREILLALRMETMESYINHKPESLSLSAAEGLRSAGDPENERPVNAFFSAYNTLGEALWDPQSIEMVELLPPGSRRDSSQGANMAKFSEIKRTLDAYSVEFFDENGNLLEDTTPAGLSDCVPGLVPVSLKFGLTVGYVKDPTILTYYAVKLKAKANLLLSPFGEVEMRAYAAAQPFGSRMGPPAPADPSEWGYGKVPTELATVGGVTPVGTVPNLPVAPGEPVAPGKGWDTKDVLGLLFGKLKIPGTTGQATFIGPDQLNAAAHAAMVPNPAEMGRYNVLSLIQPDDFEDAYFGPSGDDPSKDPSKPKIALLWAPVFPANVANPGEELKKRLSDLFAGSTGDPYAADIQNGLVDALTKYLSKIKGGTGESIGDGPGGKKGRGEGYNVLPIQEPFIASDGQVEKLGPFMVDPGNVFNFRKSWNQVGDSAVESQGRSGYSVKFVSFDSLRKGTISTDGKNSPGNAPVLDGDAQTDVPFIRH